MPAKSYRSELVGLFGYPVDENPTVVMIEAGFRELGLDYRYITMEVRPVDLEIAVKSLKALGYKGANCTIPHKVEVLRYLDHIAPDAEIIGAVNTIYLKNGETYGENTDGKGFIMSLRDGKVEIKGSRIVVLGAGGAARAIAVELAMAQAAHITLVNRDEGRGKILAAILNDRTPVKADFVLWDHTYQIPAGTDILVQATSIGLYPDTGCPDIDYDTIQSDMAVCDVIPNPPQTAFIKKAKARGARTFDGLGMLVNQGRIGFKLWTGKDAPVEVMKEALAKEFVE
ncbi:MAG: shikimate dehydrogenase [Eubacteriales bacterium]